MVAVKYMFFFLIVAPATASDGKPVGRLDMPRFPLDQWLSKLLAADVLIFEFGGGFLS